MGGSESNQSTDDGEMKNTDQTNLGLINLTSESRVKWRFMTIYDTCHITQNVMKYANMCIKRTVSIRQIDLWGSEPLESNIIMKKM